MLKYVSRHRVCLGRTFDFRHGSVLVSLRVKTNRIDQQSVPWKSRHLSSRSLSVKRNISFGDALSLIQRISKRTYPSLRVTRMNPWRTMPCKRSVNGCWITTSMLIFHTWIVCNRWLRQKHAFPTSMFNPANRIEDTQWTFRVLFEQLQQSFLQAIALSPDNIDCDLQVSTGMTSVLFIASLCRCVSVFYFIYYVIMRRQQNVFKPPFLSNQT